MTETWLHLATAVNIITPLVLVAIVGIICRIAGLIDPAFIKAASKLVFTVSLPCLMFTLVVQANWSDRSGNLLIILSLCNTLALTAIAIGASKLLVSNEKDRGVFVQGVFRGNIGIVALALVSSAYGAEGLAMAAIPITMTTLLYNILAVLLLSGSGGLEETSKIRMVLGVFKNPLIVGIGAGLTLVALNIELPSIVMDSTRMLGQLTLPLALLCVGASLDYKAMTPPDKVASWSTAGKLILAPAMAVNVAYFGFGLTGMPLGILFFITASPAATASFAMVIAFGGNSQLTAQIIALTTVFSVASIAIGTFILKFMGWM